jgi:putative transposase
MVVIKQMKRIDKIFESDNQNLEIQVLKKAMNDTKVKRMYQRYKVICLHIKGYTNLDIAALEGLDNHTVGIYVKNYKQNGIDGLLMKRSPGAPRLLTSEQEAILVEVVTTQTPDQVGFPNRKN